MIHHNALYLCFIVLIIVVSLMFVSQTIFSEEYKINNSISLNVKLSNKEINPGEQQIIKFLLSDKSIDNKTNSYAIINGNIIYLTGMAQSFSLNISNSKWYTYSWIIDPQIQKFGTVLVGIDLSYNGSRVNINNLSFNIVKEKI
ncbi:MAG: hypothetical protein ACE5SW_04490 [Nitrososphaeraceae archaeon]